MDVLPVQPTEAEIAQFPAMPEAPLLVDDETLKVES